MPQLDSTSDLCELFLDAFGTTLVDPSEIAWIDTGGTMGGTSANGGTVNTTEKSISIAASQTGRNAFLEKTFTLANLTNLEVGDVIKIHLRLTESVLETIDNDTVVITMTADGVNVDISGYEFDSYGNSGMVFDVNILYTVTSLSAQMKVKLAIKSTAPEQSELTKITWNTIGYYSNKYLFLQGIDQLAQLKSDFYTLFPHQELPSTYAILDSSGTNDVTSQLQDYINDAIEKSGVIEFKKLTASNASYYVAGQVKIEGALEMVGNGARFRANTAEIFTVKTAARIYAHHLTLMRAAGNTNNSATSFKFDLTTTTINQDSVFEFIKFIGFYTHLNLDYFKRAVIRNCDFINSQNGILMGQIDPTSVSDISIIQNRFDTAFQVGISSLSGNNLLIQENKFGNYSASQFYGGRCIVINPSSGNHSNISILDNWLQVFTDVGIRVAISNGSMEGVEIGGGRIIDGSSSATSKPIWISTGAGGTITDLNIHDVQIATKLNAIDVSNVTNLQLVGNNIRKHTGTFANSRGMNIVNSTYLSKGNTGVGLGQLNVYTGSTPLTEY